MVVLSRRLRKDVSFLLPKCSDRIEHAFTLISKCAKDPVLLKLEFSNDQKGLKVQNSLCVISVEVLEVAKKGKSNIREVL